MSQPKPQSSVRHTRAIRVAQTQHVPAAPLAAPRHDSLRALVLPATYAQLSYYHHLGLRARVLGLPVMVALVISLIWQQVGSASELLRMLAQEGILWVEAMRVTQQAVSERLLTFPAVLFARVLLDVLPLVQQR